MGSLVTWPPDQIHGFMIPGIDAIDNETNPQQFSLNQELVLNERKRERDLGGKSNNPVRILKFGLKLKKLGVSIDTFRQIFGYLLQAKKENRLQTEILVKKFTLSETNPPSVVEITKNRFSHRPDRDIVG